MTAANYNYFIRIDVILGAHFDGALHSKTYSFVNKSLKDSASVSTYWPILTEIGNITRAAGSPLPVVSIGSFTIKNSIGSFGANRKFSDVLQKYSPIERGVTIYIGEVANDSDTVSSWTQIAYGFCTGVDSSISDQSLTFSVRGASIREKVVTLEVDRNVTGMSNAPSTSLGRTVPLVIGYLNEVIPIRISEDEATIGQYAYGTCFYQSLKNQSIVVEPSVFTKNYNDDWEVIENTFTDRTGTASAGTYTLNTYAERAFALAEGSFKTGLVTGVTLSCKGNGLAVSTAYLTVFLIMYDVTTLTVVDNEVAVGRQILSTYNSQNSASTNPFDVKIAFDRPAFLSAVEGRYKYALGWRVTDYQINDLSIHYIATTDSEFRKDTANANSASGHEWRVVSGANILKANLHQTTHTFTDHVSGATEDGLTYSKLQITSLSVDTNQVSPPFDDVPILLASVTGLGDYGDTDPIQSPNELVNRLSYQYTGGAWATANEWDTTTLATRYDDLYAEGGSPSHRNRLADAVFDGKTTFTEVISAICRGTASRVGVRANGKHFMYPWGREHTPAAAIPAGDITPVSWSIAGMETVVNRCHVNTRRTYLYLAKNFENPGAESRTDYGFQYSTEFSPTNFDSVEVITNRSRSLLTDRPSFDSDYLVYPRSSTDQGDYLGSGAEGSVIAEHLLTHYAYPRTTATFIVPYHRYSALEMFDVITFAHPDFPAFYGTSAEGEEPVYEDSNTGRTNLIDGYEWVRAETYRGLIEEVTILLAREHAPAIQITCLVLLNYPIDPT
jgi:hypothetical protein